ncbi:MAG: response regulator [Fimbriimonas sp.]
MSFAMERLANESWVMVVDDSPDDAGVIDRALRRACRSERLKVCSRGDEALRLLAHSPSFPGLILVSDRLVGMSSIELIVTLRQGEETRFLPVVILSGDSHPRLVRQALSAGANSFMTKAVDFDQHIDDLRSTFHYWLDVHRGPTSPSSRVELL